MSPRSPFRPRGERRHARPPRRAPALCRYRPVPKDPEELKAKVLAGLRAATMLPEHAEIVSVWSTRLEYGYPVPYVERNMHMHTADKALRKMHIWSRGRFGSWKYEVTLAQRSAASRAPVPLLFMMALLLLLLRRRLLLRRLVGTLPFAGCQPGPLVHARGGCGGRHALRRERRGP